MATVPETSAEELDERLARIDTLLAELNEDAARREAALARREAALAGLEESFGQFRACIDAKLRELEAALGVASPRPRLRVVDDESA